MLDGLQSFGHSDRARGPGALCHAGDGSIPHVGGIHEPGYSYCMIQLSHKSGPDAKGRLHLMMKAERPLSCHAHDPLHLLSPVQLLVEDNTEVFMGR